MSSNRPPTGTSARDIRTQHFGLWEGVVVDVDDPLNLGRVRIRIAQVHDLRESKSPFTRVIWAEPCFQPGTMSPPNVGDMVWVMFRQGSVDHPVWLGVKYNLYQIHTAKGRLSSREAPVTKPSDGNTSTQEEFEKFATKNVTTWWEPPGNSAPRETWGKKNTIHPEIYMMQRTPRGHTFYMNDTPQEERIELIDRGGQMMVFSCPILNSKVNDDGETEALNDNNMGRRLDQNAVDRTQFDIKKDVYQPVSS